MKKKIIAVFKTHFDYGYTDLKENILNRYATDIIEKTVRVCENTAVLGNDLQYKWTLPSYLLMKIYDNCTATLRQRIDRLLKNGQIVAHALPFTMHTALLDKNSLENIFLFTDDYVKRFNLPFPISAKMTDVPGHSQSIIKPLTDRGVKFLHLGKNDASPAPKVPLLFWWEDSSGTRILTMYNKSYGSNFYPPKNWKYPVWLAMCNTFDNCGAQDEDFIDGLIKKAGNKYDLQTGTLDDFANEILKCDLSDLPVVKGDLFDTWIHGVGSYPKAVSEYRRQRTRFYGLSDLAKSQGVDIEAEARGFWENALTFTEHTFGINVLRYFGFNRTYDKTEFLVEKQNNPAYAFAENSWQDERAFPENMKKINDLIQTKLDISAVEMQKTTSDGIEVECGKTLTVLFKGKKISISYDYRVFGSDTIHKFMKDYLVRYVDWSISDFGRCNYPEISDKTFTGGRPKLVKTDEKYVIDFIPQKSSVNDYGNFSEIRIELARVGERLKITFIGKNKSQTPLVEAGNLKFDFYDKTDKFIITSADREVPITDNRIKNTNGVLWCTDDTVKCGNYTLETLDSPLVSFCENGICTNYAGSKKYGKAIITVNLFNNHWGTNFPQWIEDDCYSEFYLDLNA